MNLSETKAACAGDPGLKRRSSLGWRDYLGYPRVLFTLILCGLFFVLHVAFAIYMWVSGSPM